MPIQFAIQRGGERKLSSTRSWKGQAHALSDLYVHNPSRESGDARDVARFEPEIAAAASWQPKTFQNDSTCFAASNVERMGQGL